MSKKHPAKTPTNYVSPLAAGQDFFFAPPRAVYPYYEGGPSNRYTLTVYFNGNTVIGQDQYLILALPNGEITTIGNDEGVTAKLKSGIYTASYQYIHESAAGGDTATATYTFQVVENQYPIKPFTIKDTIQRILRVIEPLSAYGYSQENEEEAAAAYNALMEISDMEVSQEALNFAATDKSRNAMSGVNLRGYLNKLSKNINEQKARTKTGGDNVDVYHAILHMIQNKYNLSRVEMAGVVKKFHEVYANEIGSGLQELFSLDSSTPTRVTPVEE